ncbi:phosphonate C-P lyase system protein PhnG [Saliterribacillus persicus]|uniref:Alpha-D-ribose 1-methylphosphonate 5-triphosphate synthase subunit PhnG n=1 Tax=Saliterribacillus persicus TaxID=930114 RepID=A0A368XUH7_9BACI|nr:phosphonate C-P lyase system protein PhnG [Saliterribacillus persicus]RCW69684.1 alpha-D-ribose 1-methylphosphonate 5-triphosphate synthase subunit PhnG [Saliterribacillus persicus]
MKRKQRTEILIQDGGSLANKLAETITTKYNYLEIIKPQYGLTMVKMRETAKKSLFYVGEVLITEAKIEINQTIGIGLVIGMEKKMAKSLAIIDAAYRASLPETKNWDVYLLQREKQITELRAKEQAGLLKSKVNFETMEV